MSVDIFSYHTVRPFKYFGLTGDFWTVHSDILMATWVAMGCLLFFVILGRYYLNRDANIISAAYEKIILLFMDLCKDSFKPFNYNYFVFVASIFFFTAFCCFVGVLPFVEEATKDINTTFALALTSFFYIQYQKIRVHGVLGYLKEFTEPFFVLVPIHIIGELSKIASMSFRLFGNILGGGVILMMIIELLNAHKVPFLIVMGTIIFFYISVRNIPWTAQIPMLNKVATFSLNALFLIAWLQLFLGIFEGMIQSFVLTMLTLTYLAIGTQPDPSHDQKDAAHDQS